MPTANDLNEESDYPKAIDGLAGLEFIRAVLQSNARGGAWEAVEKFS